MGETAAPAVPVLARTRRRSEIAIARPGEGGAPRVLLAAPCGNTGMPAPNRLGKPSRHAGFFFEARRSANDRREILAIVRMLDAAKAPRRLEESAALG